MSFIDAGAGTGKTARLVRRIVRVVLNGECTIAEIAAITFTEKAAAELRDRVRVALVNASQGAPIDRVVGDPDGELPTGPDAERFAAQALRDFQLAPISTLHSFAQRIIASDPVVSGLPEKVEIIDDLAQAERFEQRWATISNALLAETGTMSEALDRSVALGVDLLKWRLIASELDGEWDRCRTWLRQDSLRVGASTRPISAVPIADVISAFEDVLAEARRLANAGVDDRLVDIVLTEIPPRLAVLRDTDPTDGFSACHALLSAIVGGTNKGQKGNWPDVDQARQQTGFAKGVLGALANEAFEPILWRIAEETVRSAAMRKASGLITFHDVLVIARDLLQSNPALRLRCRQQYRYLLVDEFQDTDPLQAEIVRALSFDGDAGLVASDEPLPLPADFDAEPGRLVFVGDPKQSIYRFRRADVGVYVGMKNRYDGAIEELRENFRSRPAIVEWTNRVFGKLLGNSAGDGQVVFSGLTAHRTDPEHGAGSAAGAPLSGPTTVAFGRTVNVNGGEDLKSIEAQAVAAMVSNALGSWEVVDRVSEARRNALPSDIAVLVRTRALLPELSRALTKLGIPFRFEGAGLAWESQEVADVLVVLAALDDPADPSKIVAALRSRALGVSDEELLAWKQVGGRFDLGRPHPDVEPLLPTVGAVPEGLAWLRRLYSGRFSLPVSAIVRTIIRDRNLEALALDEPRPRDAWSRLQMVVDTADQFVATNSTATLRDFLARCAYAAEQGTTSNERVVPEPDDNAVRVLTIHGAKGLEFPVVIVAGLGQQTRHEGLQVRWSTDEAGLAVPVMKLSVKNGDDTTDVEVRDLTYQSLTDADRDADSLEAERLAYVACTRARDHLAVSVFHRTRSKPKTKKEVPARAIGADLFDAVKVAEPGSLLAEIPDAVQHSLSVPQTGGSVVVESHADWLAERKRMLAVKPSTPELRTTRPSDSRHTGIEVVSEDGREPLVMVDEVELVSKATVGAGQVAWDPTLPRRMGSAVHQVAERMQPDDTDERLEELAVAAAAEFAVADVAVVRRAIDGLRSSSAWLRASTASRWWRELPMDGSIDGVVLAAVADLVWQQPDSTLAVADWKAHSGTADELREQYTSQLDAYGQMLEAATDLKVSERIIVAVHPRTGVVTEVPLGPSVSLD